MKHKLFMLIWLGLLAFCSVIVGILALLDRANAEVYFWTSSPIESEEGQIAWIAVSATCLVLFLVLFVRGYRKRAPGIKSEEHRR